MHASTVRDPRWVELERQTGADPSRMQKRLEAKKHAFQPAGRNACTPAGAGGLWLADVLPAIALEQLRAPVDRLEALERELLALLATAAPAMWSSSRRPFTRMLRAARSELRTRQRQSLIGDPS